MAIVTCNHGRSALAFLFSQISSAVPDEQERDERTGDGNSFDEVDWRSSPPFLCCLKNLLWSLDANNCTVADVVEILYTLSLCAMCLSVQDDK